MDAKHLDGIAIFDHLNKEQRAELATRPDIVERVEPALRRTTDVLPRFGDYHGRLEAALTPRTRVLWLNSPHNPTGSIVRRRAFEAFLDRLPEGVVTVLAIVAGG